MTGGEPGRRPFGFGGAAISSNSAVSNQDLLDVVALQLADGEAIDWAAHELALPETERRYLARLRQLEALALVHATGGDDLPAVHESVRSSQATAPDAPLRWGPLEIREKIGRGSYGDVYRARDTRLGRDVALKLLRHREHATDEENTLVHEAHLLARVRHSNVVTVYGAERIDGRAGLWMEFIRGETLEDELQRRGPLPAADVVDIGMTLCSALAAVHGAGLLHRDIKLQNVMRDADGRLVLMDFGAGDEASGGEGRLAGTPLYLAPEVLDGGAPSVSADLYALGVVLFRLATGRFPTDARTLSGIRAAHREGRLQPAASIRPDLPRALANVIDRALAPHVADRCATAAEMRDGLASLLPAAHGGRRRRATMGAIGAAAVLVMASVGWIVRHNGVARVDFAPRDFVLISRFENRTGEPVFDGALEYALERQLLESNIVNLAPIQRVHDALRLMKRPLDSVVTGSIAREVALRDGRIKLVLGGRIDRAGGTYTISAELVDPADGAIVARHTEQPKGADSIPRAVSAIARSVRTSLGERLPQMPETRAPEPATTHSLKAFQLYNQAYQLGRERQWPASLAMAREVVREDPKFGSGWIWLAWALNNIKAPSDEIRAAAERARSLVDGAPEWERLWITGSYQFLMKDFEAAAATNQALLRLRPDHFYGASNLSGALRALNRRGEASDAFVTMANLRPLDPAANIRAAAGLLAATRDVDAAQPFVDRVRATIAASEGRLDDTFDALWIGLFDVYAQWRRRDLAGAPGRLDSLTDRFLESRAVERLPVAFSIGSVYAALGKLDRADAILATIPDPFTREYHGLAILAARDDTDGFRRSLRTVARDPRFRDQNRPRFYLAAGLIGETRRIIATYSPSSSDVFEPLFVEVGRGQLELLDGKPSDAAATFAAVLPKLRPHSNLGEYQAACQGFASALAQLSRHADAVRELEMCVGEQPYLNESGWFGPLAWMKTRLQLAAEYRAVGKIDEARTIEADLQKLLALADADHPLLRQLRTQQHR